MTLVDPFAQAPDNSEATRYGDAPNPTNPVVAPETHVDPLLAAVKNTVTGEKPATKKAAVTVDVKPLIQSAELSSKVTLTFKGGSAYDAPWIVVHANDLDDALEQVTTHGEKLMAVMERVQKAGAHFVGQAPAKVTSNNINVAAAPQRQLQPGQPAGSMEAPSWAPPKPVGCEDFVYVTKIKADTGKPWHAWMPPGKDDTRKAKFFYPPR